MTIVPRRSVLTGLAGLPLAAVLADPRLAAAAAAGLETVSLTTPSGRSVAAALAVPATTPAPTVVLIHEWWGLNDQIKAVAAEFANQGYVGLAVDLYGGQTAADAGAAQSLMQAVDAEAATETLIAWSDWLKREERSTGKLGTVGWCFGGAWSLNASIATPVDATVIYYGRVERSVDDLKKLQGPVLGHFAEQDQWINREMVGGFERNMAEAGKALEVHWYDANHAFANPTGDNYRKPEAELAWNRTLDFFKAHLT